MIAFFRKLASEDEKRRERALKAFDLRSNGGGPPGTAAKCPNGHLLAAFFGRTWKKRFRLLATDGKKCTACACEENGTTSMCWPG